MALADILAAIAQQAEKQIADLVAAAARDKEALKKQADEAIAAYENELHAQTEQQKKQLKKKAETEVEMNRKKALLQAKRDALDAVYAKVLEEVQKLPAAKKKKLEDALKAALKGRKGKTESVKEGGFIFVSDNAEEDYSFEHLVNEVLRPQTELDVSANLFANR